MVLPNQSLLVNQYTKYIQAQRGLLSSSQLAKLDGFEFKAEQFTSLLTSAPELHKAFYNREITLYIHTDGTVGHVSGDLPVRQDDGSIITVRNLGLDPKDGPASVEEKPMFHFSAAFSGGLVSTQIAKCYTPSVKKVTGCEGEIASQNRSADPAKLIKATISVTEEQYQALATNVRTYQDNPPKYQVLGNKDNNCIHWMHRVLTESGIHEGLHNKFRHEEFEQLDFKAIKIPAQQYFSETQQSYLAVSKEQFFDALASYPASEQGKAKLAEKMKRVYEKRQPYLDDASDRKLASDISGFVQYHSQRHGPAMSDAPIPSVSVNVNLDSDTQEAIKTAFGEDGLIDGLFIAAGSAAPSHQAECNLLIDTIESKVLDGVEELTTELEALKSNSDSGAAAKSLKKEQIKQASLMVFDIACQLIDLHAQGKLERTEMKLKIKEVNRQVAHLDFQFKQTEIQGMLNRNRSRDLHEYIQSVMISSVAGSLEQQIEIQRKVGQAFKHARQRYEKYNGHSKSFEQHHEALKHHMANVTQKLKRLNKSSAFRQFLSDLTIVAAGVATHTKHPYAIASALALGTIGGLVNFKRKTKIASLNDRMADLQQATMLNHAGLEKSEQLTAHYLLQGRQALSFLIENRHSMSPEMLFDYCQQQRELEARQGKDLANQKQKADKELKDATQDLLKLLGKKKLKDGELDTARSRTTNAMSDKGQIDDGIEDNLDRQAQLGLQAVALHAYMPSLSAMYQFTQRHLPKDKRPDEDLYDQLKQTQLDGKEYTQAEIDEYNRLKEAADKAQEEYDRIFKDPRSSKWDINRAETDLKYATDAFQRYQGSHPFLCYSKTDWTDDIMSCFKPAFEGVKDYEAAKKAFIEAFIKLQKEKYDIDVREEDAEMIFNQNVQRAGHAMIIDCFNENLRKLNQHYATQDQLVYGALGSVSQLLDQLIKTGWFKGEQLSNMKTVDRFLKAGTAGYDLYVLGRTTYFMTNQIKKALKQASEKGLKSIIEGGTNTVLSALMGNMVGVGINIISALGTSLQIYNILMDNQPDLSPEIQAVMREVEQLRSDMKAEFGEVKDELEHIKQDVQYLRHQLDYVVLLLEAQDLKRMVGLIATNQSRGFLEALLRRMGKEIRRVRYIPHVDIQSKLNGIELMVEASGEDSLTGGETTVATVTGNVQLLLSTNPWMTINALRSKLGLSKEDYELANLSLLNEAFRELMIVRPHISKDSKQWPQYQGLVEKIRTHLEQLDGFSEYIDTPSNWNGALEKDMKRCLQEMKQEHNKIKQRVKNGVALNVHKNSKPHNYSRTFEALEKFFPQHNNVHHSIWEETLKRLGQSDDVSIEASILTRRAGTPCPKIKIDNGIIIEPVKNLRNDMLPLVFPKQYIENLKKQHPGLASLVEHEKTGYIKLKYEYNLVDEGNNKKGLYISVSFALADSTFFEPYALFSVGKATAPKIDSSCTQAQWDFQCLSRLIYGAYGFYLDGNLPRFVENTRVLGIDENKPTAQWGRGWTTSDISGFSTIAQKHYSNNKFHQILCRSVENDIALGIYTNGAFYKHLVGAPFYVFWGLGRGGYHVVSEKFKWVQDKGYKAYLKQPGVYGLLEQSDNVAKLSGCDMATECAYHVGQDDPRMHSASGVADVRQPLPNAKVDIHIKNAGEEPSIEVIEYENAASIIERSHYTLRRNMKVSIENGAIAEHLDNYKKLYGTLMLALRLSYRLSYEEAVSFLNFELNVYHPVKLYELLINYPEKLDQAQRDLTLAMAELTQGLEISDTRIAMKKLLLALTLSEDASFDLSDLPFELTKMPVNNEQQEIDSLSEKIQGLARLELATDEKIPNAEELNQQMVDELLKKLKEDSRETEAQSDCAQGTVDEGLTSVSENQGKCEKGKSPSAKGAASVNRSLFSSGLPSKETMIAALQKHLRFKPIPLDGHCMYHSLAHYMSGETVQSLRVKVSDEMNRSLMGQSEQSPFCDPLTGDSLFLAEFLDKDDPVDAFIADSKRVRETSQWGDAISIQVLQFLVKRPIIVFQNGTAQAYVDDQKQYTENVPIFLYRTETKVLDYGPDGSLCENELMHYDVLDCNASEATQIEWGKWFARISPSDAPVYCDVDRDKEQCQFSSSKLSQNDTATPMQYSASVLY